VTPLERRRRILGELHDKGEVLVRDLAMMLEVTAVTVRTDLDHLARRGLIVKSHGGAVLPEGDSHIRYITRTIHENFEPKDRIAERAARLVEAGSTVILDAGSTGAILARHLHGMDITVVTNSVPVIAELVSDEKVNLIAAGGAIRKQVNATVGEIARRTFESMHVDLLFLGASGWSVNEGVTTVNLLEAETKRSMIAAASRVCLIADATKAGEVRFARICGWDAVDMLITDRIDPDVAERLTGLGVAVHIADR